MRHPDAHLVQPRLRGRLAIAAAGFAIVASGMRQCMTTSDEDGPEITDAARPDVAKLEKLFLTLA